MKDASHHLRYVQKKVLQSVHRNSNSANGIEDKKNTHPEVVIIDSPQAVSEKRSKI